MKNSFDEKILDEANDWLKAKRKVILATVIKTWGASPRPIASRMIVNDKGDFSGSVSGGCVETAVVRECLKLFAILLSMATKYFYVTQKLLNCFVDIHLFPQAISSGDPIIKFCLFSIALIKFEQLFKSSNDPISNQEIPLPIFSNLAFFCFM